ncbi:uncharacterized protein [Dysidea avara]|uniref:uncharacterized protein isoform X2 n=1 Tax=Dysidea avara TaxID=196820 RepID=UPI00331C4198
MLGVYYPNTRAAVPVKVMEFMEYTLKTFVDFHHNIPMYVKLSILQDISRGINYLHTLNPPVIHCDLDASYVLVNKNLMAKVCVNHDMKVLTPNSKSSKCLPYFAMLEQVSEPDHVKQSLSQEVLLFGLIICYVINQQWPIPKPNAVSDPRTHQVMRASYFRSDRREEWIDQISDQQLKKLVISCLEYSSKKRPSMSRVCEMIDSVIDSYSNDETTKMAFSLAVKEGFAQSRDLQLLLVGAENTGKTCLISSFLGEEFVEGQAATKGVDVDVCKIYCKDWTRISHSDKTSLLHHQFIHQCRTKVDVLKETVSFKGDMVLKSFSQQTSKAASTAPVSVRPIATTTATSTTTTAIIDKEFPEPHLQDLQDFSSNNTTCNPDSINAVLWDFPGQVIFHNTHLVFISESGVAVITFNASMKLTCDVVPREGSLPPQECHTIISNIHYWLQVVDSMCSVKGHKGDLSPVQPTAILAGTHIDKLHPDIDVARKISKEMILPQLIEELSDKPYAQHLAGMAEGIEAALEQYCFFISNKCRDKEIERLKYTAINAATSLRKPQPIFFLKIERALLQHKEQIIQKSAMAEVIAESAFPIAENSSEFEGVLRYFHEKRVILYFSRIKSLRNIVILSPRWLAKLFSYIITAHSYKRGTGLDEAWKRLTKYGILHESLLQHMLDKFHSDYPSAVTVTKQQVVDILVHFHLVARITREAWFSEEGFPSLPDSGDTFIVPSLVPRDDGRNPPNSPKERIIHFKFASGFVHSSLLNQVIADCICRNVEKNSRLLRMRYGMVELQLDAHQRYYISRCEENSSIQLTISMPERDDETCVQERQELINDITKLLIHIMDVFMPAGKKPVPLVPCSKCPILHITLSELCSGGTIFCTTSGETTPLSGHYSDLLPTGLSDPMVQASAKRKLKVFTTNYSKLTNVLPIRSLTSYFVAEKIIRFEDEQVIQQTVRQSEAVSVVLRKVAGSLEAGQTKSFDKLVTIMELYGGISCEELANRLRRELLQNNTTEVDQSSAAQEDSSRD